MFKDWFLDTIIPAESQNSSRFCERIDLVVQIARWRKQDFKVGWEVSGLVYTPKHSDRPVEDEKNI